MTPFKSKSKSKSGSRANCNDECPKPLFKIDTPTTDPKTVFNCDTVELCSNTLDIDVSGCWKTKVTMENSPFTKKLPIQQGQTVQPGDLVAIAKTGDQLGVRKLLCEQWEWVAGIDTEVGDIELPPGKEDDEEDDKGIQLEKIGNLDAIALNNAKAIATDSCGNVYVAGFGIIADFQAVTDEILEQLLEGEEIPDDVQELIDFFESKDNIIPEFYNTGPDGNTLNTPELMGIDATIGFGSYIGKLNPNGVWEWVAAVDIGGGLGIGGGLSIESLGLAGIPTITVDRNGNVYMVGGAGENKPIFYNAGPNGSTISSGNEIMGRNTTTDTSQIFVGKLNSSGQWEWAAAIDNSTSLSPSIVADQCGNIYVSSGSDGAIFYDAGPDGSTVTTTTGNEIKSLNGSIGFIAKIKSTGQWEWVTSINFSISGNVIIRGLLPLLTSLATDSCGNVYGSSIYLSASDEQLSSELLFYDAGPDGSTITDSMISGISTSTLDIGVFVSKLKPTGKWEWVAQISSPSIDLFPSVAADSCGNVYVTSYGAGIGQPLFYDTGPEGSTITTGKELIGISTASFDNQIFIGKIKNNGKWEWATAIDSPVNEGSPSVATDSCGNVYVTGFGSAGSAPVFYDAGVTGNTTTFGSQITGRTSIGSQIFIGKLIQDGRWQWAVSIDDVLSLEEKKGGKDKDEDDDDKDKLTDVLSFVTNGSVTVDDCGNIYVAGATSSEFAPTFYNAGPDGSTIQGPTGNELFGRQTTTNNPQVFVGKLANDPKTQPVIGIVQQVDQLNNAIVKFGGVIDSKQDEPLEPGCPYYINSYGPVDPTVSKLTTEPCNPDVCNCPNRCLGTSCDEKSIIWELEDPLCVKPKCCCCSVKTSILNNNI